MKCQYNEITCNTKKRSEVRRRLSGVVTPTLKSDKGVRIRQWDDSAVREYSKLAYLGKRAVTVLLWAVGGLQRVDLGLLWALSPFPPVGLTHRVPIG